MFWRERDRDNREQNGLAPCGQVRVLVVGDSGVGKTSLVHLIIKGSAVSRPDQTIGCAVDVKLTTYGSCGSSSNSIKGDAEKDFFVELWDVSGHDRYKDCRSLFYSQINGVIFVHDISQKRTKTSLQKWAAEVAALGTFSAARATSGPVALPVPYIVIGNKADIAAMEGMRGSSGNLVDAARQWVEKQGLLPSSEIPLTESFPGSSNLLAAAKLARFDKEAVMKFFQMLIRRRYFSEELPPSNLWTLSPLQKSILHSSENLRGDNSSDSDKNNKRSSLSSNTNKQPILSSLTGQGNLTPPPSLYPQQPISASESYVPPRFSFSVSQDFGGNKSKRTDINV